MSATYRAAVVGTCPERAIACERAPPARLERAATCLGNRCSIHLSYGGVSANCLFDPWTRRKHRGPPKTSLLAAEAAVLAAAVRVAGVGVEGVVRPLALDLPLAAVGERH